MAKKITSIAHFISLYSGWDITVTRYVIAGIVAEGRPTVIRLGGLAEIQFNLPMAIPKQKPRQIERAHYPLKPPTPDNAGWDAVFDWYYSVPRCVCRGLEELSRMISCAYGTVRRMHLLYKSEYGEQPMHYLGDKNE